jgi:mono/diheme cytochrome c family protein
MWRIILPAVFAFVVAFSGAALAADGEKFFKEICGVCHGLKGLGSPLAPALKGNEFLEKASVDDLKKLIRGGRKMKDKKYPQFPIEMPEHPQFTDEQVEAIIEYEKTHILKQ